MSCGGKNNEMTSCQVVGERLAVLDAGRMAKFMTQKDRRTRAERWQSTCAPWTEDQRKCVLAADSMEAASRRTGPLVTDGSDASIRDGATNARWTVKPSAEKATISGLAIASDGDIITAGELRQRLVFPTSTVEIGGDGVWFARFSPSGELRWARGVTIPHERPYIKDLAIGTDGRILADVTAKAPANLTRIVVAPDGSSHAPHHISNGEFADSEIVSEGAVVIGTRGAKDPCAGSTFPLHGLSKAGVLTWSTCGDKSISPAIPSGMRYLATDSEQRVALCGSFVGDAPAWAGTKPPATPTGTHAVVAAFTADGNHRWSHYVTSSDRDTCEGLAVTGAGVVAALVDSLPAMSVLAWKPDGALSWSKTCNELAPGDRDCNITAIATHADDVVVAAQNGGRTTFARIDPSGSITRVGAIQAASIINELAPTPTDIVFAAAFDLVIGSL